MQTFIRRSADGGLVGDLVGAVQIGKQAKNRAVAIEVGQGCRSQMGDLTQAKFSIVVQFGLDALYSTVLEITAEHILRI
jgi:hypothetical protein